MKALLELNTVKAQGRRGIPFVYSLFLDKDGVIFA